MSLERKWGSSAMYFPGFPEGAIEAIAHALGKEITEVDWQQTDPHDAIRAVMFKKHLASYDWSRFEADRQNVPGIKFPNVYVVSPRLEVEPP